MTILLPDPCVFFWSSGKTPQMRSMFRPTFGWGAATNRGGGHTTSGHLMKWGYSLHYMLETYTVSTSKQIKGIA